MQPLGFPGPGIINTFAGGEGEKEFDRKEVGAEMNFAEYVLGATTETLVTSRQLPSPLGAATAPEPE